MSQADRVHGGGMRQRGVPRRAALVAALALAAWVGCWFGSNTGGAIVPPDPFAGPAAAATRPATTPVATSAAPDAEAVGQTRAALQRRIGRLTKQKALRRMELEEEVGKSLRLKEMELGMDLFHTDTGWNGRQLQLDRLLQEQARVQAELAGYRSRLNTVKRDLDEGRTPAEVEEQIRAAPDYVNARRQLDDAELELQLARAAAAKDDPGVAALRRRASVFGARAAAVREALRSEYSETMKARFQNDIDAASANAGRIEDAIQTIAMKLVELNKTLDGYRTLKEHERHLRQSIRALDEQIEEANLAMAELPLP